MIFNYMKKIGAKLPKFVKKYVRALPVVYVKVAPYKKT